MDRNGAAGRMHEPVGRLVENREGLSMTKAEAKRDAEFLAEAEDRLEKGRNGDSTQFDYLAQMLSDWRKELERCIADKN